MRILVYAMLLGFISSAPSLSAAQTGVSVPFVTISRGTMSAIRQPGHFVIRDATRWRALWRRHSASTPPEVNFARHMVIAVFAGETTEPAAVSITRITRGGNRLTVGYRVISGARPLPDSYVTSAAAPFHFVRTARSGLPVSFVVMKTVPVMRQP